MLNDAVILDSAEKLEQQKEERFLVIKRLKIDVFHGETIGKIASSRYFVNKKANISDLAYDMDHHKSIMAVGVVNDKHELTGIIIRRDLFDVLGKPYGRDIFQYKTVDKIVLKAKSFSFERNIFSVAEEIGENIQSADVEYFLLYSGEKYFAGIFTTRDILIYLSNITQTDINLARQIQKSLVKDEVVYEQGSFTAIGASRMAKGVGGDFYDARRIGEERWLFSVCDVSGKGVSASLLTTSISGMYHMYDFSRGVANFISKLNEYIYFSFQSEKFVTGLFVELNEKNGEMILYDMGHSYMYIQKNNRLFRLKTSRENIPLGVKPSLTPFPDKYSMTPGEILFTITDGIIEQKNSAGLEYGDKRLSTIIRTNKNIKSVKDCIFQDIDNFRGSQTQLDDMTLLILSFSGNVSPLN